MKEPAGITREECLAIHEMMLAQHGGRAGVREEGLLKSALSKPPNLFAREDRFHCRNGSCRRYADRIGSHHDPEDPHGLPISNLRFEIKRSVEEAEAAADRHRTFNPAR
jgi:hypothetical protein